MILLNGLNVSEWKFPNNELNILFIEQAFKDNSSCINHFVLKYENDSDLMALYFAKKQADLRTNNISVLSITYMPYSRMDRAETEETPFMLKYVSEFINDLGFDSVYVHEPHSQVTMNLLKNAYCILDNTRLLDKVKEKEGFIDTEDYIVFPDKGAYERYNGEIRAKNILYGKKVRDFNTGEIKGLELEGNTSNINSESIAIIVDDLSSYGGTFIRVSDELKKLGFTYVILLVCHAENSIFKGKLFEHVNKVYTTDSMLTEHTNWENQLLVKEDKLEVFEMIKNLKEGVHR